VTGRNPCGPERAWVYRDFFWEGFMIIMLLSFVLAMLAVWFAKSGELSTVIMGFAILIMQWAIFTRLGEGKKEQS
jgi:hypothetical protein